MLSFVINILYYMITYRYFSQSKLTSYQRQLSLYGFSRITCGKDRGAYYHELFLRGRPDLLDCIDRKRVKGTGSKLAASPETEPDFYDMEFCSESNSGPPKEATKEAEDSIEATITVDEDQSTEIGHLEESPSLASEDESFEASTASLCEEFFVASDEMGQSNVLQEPTPVQPEKSFLKMVTSNSNVHPSTADFCEAELLAEFGQDVLESKTVTASTRAAATRYPAVKPTTRVGPLSIPGQFRNAFGKGIRSTCVHSINGSAGSVVKYIPMDLEMAERWERAEQEYMRFQKPLESKISFDKLDHINWEPKEETAQDHPDAQVSPVKQVAPDTAAPILPGECSSSCVSDAHVGNFRDEEVEAETVPGDIQIMV